MLDNQTGNLVVLVRLELKLKKMLKYLQADHNSLLPHECIFQQLGVTNLESFGPRIEI